MSDESVVKYIYVGEECGRQYRANIEDTLNTKNIFINVKYSSICQCHTSKNIKHLPVKGSHYMIWTTLKKLNSYCYLWILRLTVTAKLNDFLPEIFAYFVYLR